MWDFWLLSYKMSSWISFAGMNLFFNKDLIPSVARNIVFQSVSDHKFYFIVTLTFYTIKTIFYQQK
jgi:hypothetical protein